MTLKQLQKEMIYLGEKDTYDGCAYLYTTYYFLSGNWIYFYEEHRNTWNYTGESGGGRYINLKEEEPVKESHKEYYEERWLLPDSVFDNLIKAMNDRRKK